MTPCCQDPRLPMERYAADSQPFSPSCVCRMILTSEDRCGKSASWSARGGLGLRLPRQPDNPMLELLANAVFQICAREPIDECGCHDRKQDPVHSRRLACHA